MMQVLWLLLFAIAVAFGVLVWRSLRKWEDRKRTEEERFRGFIAGVTGSTPQREEPPAAAPPATAADELAPQKLLFDAAHKAGEAGEPALAIQLYARLLARYPATAFADQARNAVDIQKRKLAKA